MKKLQSLIVLLSVISINAQLPAKRVGIIHVIKNGKVYVDKAPKVGPKVPVYRTWVVAEGETTGAGPVQRPYTQRPYVERGKINVREVVKAVRQQPMVSRY